MNFWRALMTVIDGPAHMRIKDELRQACPTCGHHMPKFHDEDGACRACGPTLGRRCADREVA